MFQDFALFPHKDVAANVAFGLRMQAVPRRHIADRVMEVLELVGLQGYDQRRVYDLSGGEQQRVALARSLAPGPRLLMLDEPLGSLDRALREDLMNELRRILKQVSVTTIYVTHDQQEAFAIADRVLVLNQGRLVQHGTPQEVYRGPANAWMAQFLGLSNLITGHVTSSEPCRVATSLGNLLVEGAGTAEIGQTVTLLIRPEAAIFATSENQNKANSITAKVCETSFRGSYYRLIIEHETGTRLSFQLASDSPDLAQPGDQVTFTVRPGAISLLAEERNAPSGKMTNDKNQIASAPSTTEGL
jgi:ABC-type Fe3+/spermidine/putrescine transport system ATPase subunit